MDTSTKTLHYEFMRNPDENTQRFINDKVVEVGSPDIFADAVGVSSRTVYKWRRGAAVRRSNLEKIAKAFGVTTEYILNYESTPEALLEVGEGHVNGYALVKKVGAKLAAGDGSFEVEDNPEGLYAFRESWLRRRGSIPDMVLMDVTGDSMLPTLPDGTMVLIDQSQNTIVPGKIYAIGIDDYVRCKRLEVGPGRLFLISDNKEVYPREEVSLGEQSDVRILGRVIWSAREH